MLLRHDPVMLEEIRAAYRSIQKKQTVIDATQGLGGHTRMLLEEADPDALVIGIDRDSDNIRLAESLLADISIQKNYHSVHASFADIDAICRQYSIHGIDAILYDLGVSSAHYDDGDRGFSWRFDAPLDMRFDRTHGITAADLVMSADAAELKRIFYEYADEPKAHFIAEAIVKSRQDVPIRTTSELLSLVARASFDKKSPIRVFQALRIVVNDEFGHIRRSLESVVDRMNLGGLIMIITFHSIEDRFIKHFFESYITVPRDPVTGQDIGSARYKKYTKKPIVPTTEEIQKNPRSRSAKLRIYERIS